MSGTCSTRGDIRNVFKILVRKPEGKRSWWRYRSKLEENIRMEVKEQYNVKF